MVVGVVLVAQPLVVVDEDVAVVRALDRSLVGAAGERSAWERSVRRSRRDLTRTGVAVSAGFFLALRGCAREVAHRARQQCQQRDRAEDDAGRDDDVARPERRGERAERRARRSGWRRTSRARRTTRPATGTRSGCARGTPSASRCRRPPSRSGNEGQRARAGARGRRSPSTRIGQASSGHADHARPHRVAQPPLHHHDGHHELAGCQRAQHPAPGRVPIVSFAIDRAEGVQAPTWIAFISPNATTTTQTQVIRRERRPTLDEVAPHRSAWRRPPPGRAAGSRTWAMQPAATSQVSASIATAQPDPTRDDEDGTDAGPRMARPSGEDEHRVGLLDVAARHDLRDDAASPGR